MCGKGQRRRRQERPSIRDSHPQTETTAVPIADCRGLDRPLHKRRSKPARPSVPPGHVSVLSCPFCRISWPFIWPEWRWGGQSRRRDLSVGPVVSAVTFVAKPTAAPARAAQYPRQPSVSRDRLPTADTAGRRSPMALRLPADAGLLPCPGVIAALQPFLQVPIAFRCPLLCLPADERQERHADPVPLEVE